MRHASLLRRGLILAVVLGTLAGVTLPLHGQGIRVADLVTRPGPIPRRLVGYGLVVGLDGTGDRSFGGLGTSAVTVRSVANLLRRFNIEVPPDQMRLRNVAAVLVTAEASPYLRAGGRIEVQVAALSDATSLRGGVLWMTPLVEDPNAPPVATAQGPLIVSGDALSRGPVRSGNAGRIPDGGILEVDPEPVPLDTLPRLSLRRPDLGSAQRIAAAINAALGPGIARVADPGLIALKFGTTAADSVLGYLAAIDTLVVRESPPARIVIDAREGTVIAGGEIPIGAASVSHRGLTLSIGGTGAAAGDSTGSGLVRAGVGASVSDVAAGLFAAGAKPTDLSAIFDALRAAGAIRAEVVIR